MYNLLYKHFVIVLLFMDYTKDFYRAISVIKILTLLFNIFYNCQMILIINKIICDFIRQIFYKMYP